jgi:molecular chaperone DnaK (HSP70)
MGKLISLCFGNAFILAYALDESTNQVEAINLEDISLPITLDSLQDKETIYPIPAMICFDDRIFYGQEVRTYKKFFSPHTFLYMKQYIAKNQHLPRIIGNQEISNFQAAETLMISIIHRIEEIYGADNISMYVFPVPPKEFEIFAQWIEKFCFRIGLVNFKIVDNGVCSLLAYGLGHELGTNFMYLNFGPMCLDLYILKVEESSSEPRLRSVLLGGLSKNYGSIDIHKSLRDELADYKITVRKAAQIVHHLINNQTFEDEINGLQLRFGRTQLYELLNRKGHGQELKNILADLIDLASGIGVTYESVQYVLCAGSSLQLPYYLNILKDFFGDKLLYNKAHNTLPLGGLAYLQHQDSGNTIKANYALRSRTVRGEGYKFDIIIPKGTAYPTQNGVTTVIANGFYDGQKELELDIFRMDIPESSNDREIVMTENGAFQVEENISEEQKFFVNEAKPEIISLDPSGKSGEKRLEITFDVSINKDLLITVKDLRRNMTIWKRKKSIRLE